MRFTTLFNFNKLSQCLGIKKLYTFQYFRSLVVAEHNISFLDYCDQNQKAPYISFSEDSIRTFSEALVMTQASICQLSKLPHEIDLFLNRDELTLGIGFFFFFFIVSEGNFTFWDA